MTLQDPKMPLLERIKAAGSVLMNGQSNDAKPLSKEPDDRSRGNLVKQWNDTVLEERKFWKPIFDRIRQEQKFAAGQQWINSKKQTSEIEDYVGDMVQQIVNRKTASLYAKNPTPEAVLKERLNFAVWDGNQQTIDNCKALIGQLSSQVMQAHEAEAQGQQVPPPPPQMAQDIQQAQQILDDYNQGMQEKALIEKVARTGELLISEQWGEQSPDMIISAKQAVTRTITSRVAFCKVLYRRDMENVASDNTNNMDFADKISQLKQRLAELENEILTPDAPENSEIEILKENIKDELQDLMENGGQMVSDEGIVLDWLQATSVIIDRRCKCMKEFIGAHWIAHEMLMSVQECESKYGVSLRNSGAKIYSETGDGFTTEDRTDYENDDKGYAKKFKNMKVCVWEIQDKDTGTCYTICDGVKDFLKEPYELEPEVNRFWSIVPLTFNSQEVENNDPDNDATIYPRSDVRLMMPMQINVNTAGQEKRKHRSANRPAWVGVKDKFASTAGQSDLEKLARPRDGHDVLMLQGLNSGEKIQDFIQPLPKQPFDQWLYDNGQDTQAMMLATGMQASDIGDQRPDEKATGQNIAAQARATSEASNIDDLNFFFTTIAQMMWEMLISPEGMQTQMVQKKVGKGAVWADVPIKRQDIANSIFFKIEAGSMGRPNQQAELQKIQVLSPQILQMLQMMGRSPEPFLKRVIRAFDANIDVDDLLKEAQVLPPPAPQQDAQKPPSVSISANIKDLPPEEANQAIQKYYGLNPASPESTLLNKVGHGNIVKPQPISLKNT